MKLQYTVDGKLETVEGDVGDLLSSLHRLLCDDKEVEVKHVVMTPEEQLEAFDGMLAYYDGD